MSGQNVLVSVIIPTYARNDSLARAIECIQAQTYSNLEIIVVDDNVPESNHRKSTEKLMETYLQDSRVTYIKNEQNLGGAGARNVGIEAANGEYVAFLDDDDFYYPTKIEKQLAVFFNSQDEHLALVYCDVEHVWASGKVQTVIEAKHRGNCLYEAIIDDCIASTSLWLVKKDYLVSVGNFSIVPCKQDSTVIIKLLKAGYSVDYCSDVLVKYYNEPSGERISFNGKKYEGECLLRELCRSCYSLFDEKQINQVEYSFDKRLFIYFSYHRHKPEGRELCKKYERNMLQRNWSDAVKTIIRQVIHIKKNRFKAKYNK